MYILGGLIDYFGAQLERIEEQTNVRLIAAPVA